MISEVSLGGHWRAPWRDRSDGWWWGKFVKEEVPDDVAKNRTEVVSRAIDCGMNELVLTEAEECLCYGAALKGRREKMIVVHRIPFGSADDSKLCPRRDENCNVKAQLYNVEECLRHIGTEYLDIWRVQAKPLFNGKNLAGWTFSEPQTKNAWIVEDGVLVNKGRAQRYICTKDDYTNYVLRFQYRRLGRRKGGVMLRLAGSDRSEPKCIHLYEKGDDFDRIGATDFALKEHRDTLAFRKLPEKLWNECEIVLNKGRLKVKVNDVPRTTATECEQTPGKIGFEASGGHVQYRNIVLIPILSD